MRRNQCSYYHNNILRLRSYFHFIFFKVLLEEICIVHLSIISLLFFHFISETKGFLVLNYTLTFLLNQTDIKHFFVEYTQITVKHFRSIINWQLSRLAFSEVLRRHSFFWKKLYILFPLLMLILLRSPDDQNSFFEFCEVVLYFDCTFRYRTVKHNQFLIIFYLVKIDQFQFQFLNKIHIQYICGTKLFICGKLYLLFICGININSSYNIY